MSVCFVLAFLYKGNSFTQIKRTEPEVVLTMNNLLNDILDLSLEYLLSHTFLCLVFLVNFRKCSNTSILDLGRKKIKDTVVASKLCWVGGKYDPVR